MNNVKRLNLDKKSLYIYLLTCNNVKKLCGTEGVLVFIMEQINTKRVITGQTMNIFSAGIPV